LEVSIIAEEKKNPVITLYSWSTPNGRKVSIMLEECGLPYAVKPVDIRIGEQFMPEFLAVNPNGKIPLSTRRSDGEPINLFESGAILDLAGNASARHVRGKYEALQWLMFQMVTSGRCWGRRTTSCASPRAGALRH
jgi:GST-like protein